MLSRALCSLLFSAGLAASLAVDAAAQDPAGAGTGAEKQDPTVLKGVVELFTSQGCASCPPADAALKNLIEDGSIVALAYHVDYWNYLGWADTLASKENTARQYAYARMFGRNGVYTPQAVLNGRDHINGGNLGGIRQKLAEMKDTGKGMRVPVEVIRKGDEIDISIGAGDGKANIVVVYFTRQKVVDVEKGENGGKKIRYVLPASVLDEEKDSGCAVLVQKMKSTEIPGAIIGATTLLAATGQ